MRLAVVEGRCSGCRACLTLCSLAHLNENNPKMAALKVVPHFPVPGTYEVKVCTQCGECANVCPVECIRLVDGVYKLDVNECINCGACAEVCPEKVINQHQAVAHAIKCDACGECVRYCPREAIIDLDKEVTWINTSEGGASAHA